MYGLIAAFWVVVPTLIAYVGGKDVPFPTLFATIQALERRARPVAVLVAAGITILLIHLAFYPWPKVIPDLPDLHRSHERQSHVAKKHHQPAPDAP
jgi:hypothetical protein